MTPVSNPCHMWRRRRSRSRRRRSSSRGGAGGRLIKDLTALPLPSLPLPPLVYPTLPPLLAELTSDAAGGQVDMYVRRMLQRSVSEAASAQDTSHLAALKALMIQVSSLLPSLPPSLSLSRARALSLSRSRSRSRSRSHSRSRSGALALSPAIALSLSRFRSRPQGARCR